MHSLAGPPGSDCAYSAAPLSICVADKFPVLIWREWGETHASATWDGLLVQFQDYTVYQSYGWGEHKRRFGWRPLRLVATRDAQMVSMAQVLVKRYPLRMGLAGYPVVLLASLDCGTMSSGRPFGK